MSSFDAFYGEFDRAGLTPLLTQNGHRGFSALCPLCPRTLRVTQTDGGSCEISCPGGCEHSRIVDRVHLRAERNPEAGTTIAPVSSWSPVPLARVLDGSAADMAPSMLERSDGHALLYPGRVHLLFGEPEACKGWIALTACRERLEAGERVLYVDFEDSAASVAGRLLAMGLEPETIATRFVYIRPEEPLSEEVRPELERAAQGASIAVLDGFTEALALHGLDIAGNTDVAAFRAMLARPLAGAGAAVLELDHEVKDKEKRGRGPIGAQHKLAGADVAYRVTVIEPFGRGREGKVKISVTKDRPGHVRGFASEGRVAEVSLKSAENGGVTVELQPPEGGSFRPTVLMEKIHRTLDSTPLMSKGQIRETVPGKTDAKLTALQCLVTEGYVEEVRDGQALRYRVTAPFATGSALPENPGSATPPRRPPSEGGVAREEGPPDATAQANTHSNFTTSYPANVVDGRTGAHPPEAFDIEPYRPNGGAP